MKPLTTSFHKIGRKRFTAILLASFAGYLQASESASVTIQGSYSEIKGNENAYQARTNQDPDTLLAIAKFESATELDSGALLSLNGILNPAEDEYHLDLELASQDWGYIDLLYDQFRTDFYAAGVYMPETEERYTWQNPLHSIDRKLFSIGGAFTKDELSKLFFRYTRRERAGSKSSTIWSENNQNRAIGEPKRGIVPSVFEVDETWNMLELGVEKAFEHILIGLNYQHIETERDKTRKLDRSPANESTQRKVTQAERNESKTSIIRTYLDTAPNASETFRFTTSTSYLTQSGDFSGSRIYGDAFDSPYGAVSDPRIVGDLGFINQLGRNDLYQFIANANLNFKPKPHWSITTSARLEKISKESIATDTETDWVRNPADFQFTGGETLADNFSEDDYDQFTGRIEARYTKLKNFSLYSRAAISSGEGYIKEDRFGRATITVPGNRTSIIARANDYRRKSLIGIIGGQWYPQGHLTFRFRYSYGDRSNRYDPIFSESAPNSRFLYPNYLTRHELKGHSYRIGLNYQPRPNLRLSSLYQNHSNDQQTTSIEDTSATSGKHDSYTISQSISWTLHSRLHISATASKLSNELRTPANDVVGAFENTVPFSSDQFWYATLGSRFLIDETRNIAFDYAYIDTGEYFDNSSVSVPYGHSLEERIIKLAYGQTFENDTTISLGYQYRNSSDSALSGLNDYTAHQFFVSLKKPL